MKAMLESKVLRLKKRILTFFNNSLITHTHTHTHTHTLLRDLKDKHIHHMGKYGVPLVPPPIKRASSSYSLSSFKVKDSVGIVMECMKL
jgi:hypothetical protein